MKIYLAGSCASEDRTQMTKIAQIIRSKSSEFEVYCPFELKIPDAWDYSQEIWARMVFEEDAKALNESDLVILISPGRKSTAGSNWEHGYAFAKGKRILVFQYSQEPTSLMTYSACEEFLSFQSWEQMYRHILLNMEFSNFLPDKDRKKSDCSTVLT